MMITEAYRKGIPIFDDDGNHRVLVSLDLEEEKELARSIFSMLRQRTFSGDDREFLEEVYWEGRCEAATILWAENFMTTVEIIQRWYDLGWFEVYKPAFMHPEFEPSNSSIFEKRTAGHPDIDDMTVNVNAITNLLLVWESEWQKTRDDLIKLSDAYKEFSGSKSLKSRFYLRHPDAQLERAAVFEEKFWQEVDDVQAKMKMSRRDSYDYARDYMRRGRDVIPRILMRHWMEIEKVLPEEYPTWVHFMHEDWIDEAIVYSTEQERFLPKAPERAN